MNLGETTDYEIWFLPANVVNYEPRRIQTLDSADDAVAYICAEAAKYAGTLEVVRATTTRRRVVCGD